MNHPQGQCPDPQLVHIAGDRTRTTYGVCAECRAIYEGMGLVFLRADTPEWVQRAQEKRLPYKVAA